MPPDDLPIPSTADDTTGVNPKIADKKQQPRNRGAESEVRGGAERPDDPPLEQQRREEKG